MYIVFDLGGTNIRLAASSGRALRSPVLLRAPRSYAKLLALMKEQATLLAGSERITGIAGGIAGPLDAEKTKLIQSTHLPHLVHQPFKRDLARIFRCPVQLENDNALVGLGEATYGAGRGYRIVASIAFGTGIGGARIVDGAVDVNALGFEPGHHIIDYHVRRHQHISPHPGDWESLVSGSGMRVRFNKASEHITSRVIWNEMAGLAAVGLINVSVFWSPDIIVLGGSLMKRLPLAVIKKTFQKKLKVFPRGPRIVRAKLGDFSGLYGGLALLRQNA